MMVCVDSCGFRVGFVERRTALTKTELRNTGDNLGSN